MLKCPTFRGVMVYGDTSEEAISRIEALALRMIAKRIAHGETIPDLDDLFTITV